MPAAASWRISAESISAGILSPTTIFSPAATPAHSIYTLSLLVFGVIGGIFLVVGGLLLYALLKYRLKPTDENATEEPAQIYGSNQIELSWTVIPILIVVMLFLATARVIFVNEHARKPGSALNVTVIGHQFWWEYNYPTLGIVTANELHIPISAASHPTPSYLTMSSADMDHSFWVPRLAGKRDVIPNKINILWMDPSMQTRRNSLPRGLPSSNSLPDRILPWQRDVPCLKETPASAVMQSVARWRMADLAQI